MTNTTTLIIHHDLDLSPAEVAAHVGAILSSDRHISKISYTDVETVIWTAQAERKAGIVVGRGYGSSDHLRLLRRAGYGATEGVATPDNPDWEGMTGAEIVAHEFGPVTTEVES